MSSITDGISLCDFISNLSSRLWGIPNFEKNHILVHIIFIVLMAPEIVCIYVCSFYIYIIHSFSVLCICIYIGNNYWYILSPTYLSLFYLYLYHFLRWLENVVLPFPVDTIFILFNAMWILCDIAKKTVVCVGQIGFDSLSQITNYHVYHLSEYSFLNSYIWQNYYVCYLFSAHNKISTR